jgi:hypothetical protein
MAVVIALVFDFSPEIFCTSARRSSGMFNVARILSTSTVCLHDTSYYSICQEELEDGRNNWRLVEDLFPSTPLEIIPGCSARGLGFIMIPAEFNAPLNF